MTKRKSLGRGLEALLSSASAGSPEWTPAAPTAETGLRAVEIVVGMSDSKYTELVSGELTEGQKLVTGIQPKN